MICSGSKYDKYERGIKFMATTSVTIRMDEILKKQVEVLFEEMGLNMTTAITIYAKTVVRQRKIPFEISANPIKCDSEPADVTADNGEK